MRDPLRLISEIGPMSFIVVQILFAGMLISAIAHPIIIITGIALLAALFDGHGVGLYGSTLLSIDIVSLVSGYLSFLLLGYRASETGQRKAFWKVAAFTPVYWLMISAAAWCALYEIIRRPHHWEKTPHRQARIPLDG